MQMRKLYGLVGFIATMVFCVLITRAMAVDVTAQKVTQGCLIATGADGKTIEVPLKHTSVHAGITGFLAQVEVRQQFHNPYDEKIEAVYVFPLPENAAVSEMLMIIGRRTVYGEIKKRIEARRIYEAARAAGKRAALLEQERPNIFTQSVANIQPGEDIIISIWYVQPLKFDRGTYRYVFPMVVGPRFIPGAPTGHKGTGWAPDTTKVPDASRISPPVLKPGTRSGHDIMISVELDAGVPIEKVWSKSHEVDIHEIDDSLVNAALQPHDTIPNKDFVLEYTVAGDTPRSAVLAHKSQLGGYFMLILQPDIKDIELAAREPKEIFFVLDCSGSMSGYPIKKSKEAMYWCIQGISPEDTFQIIRFSSRASAFAPEPIPSTRANKQKALEYISGLYGSGGTMMIEGIKACLDYPQTPGRQRIVFFLTDGFIGNDNEILAAVKQKVGTTKLFSFGVGSSPNRSLLERMAKLGGGTAQFIRQDEPAEKTMTEMMARISKPYLANLSLEWNGVEVSDIYPEKLPVLFSAQPLILFGRFDKGGEGSVTLRGTLAGEPFEQTISVNLPDWEPENASLPLVWARQKIMNLMFEQLGAYAPNLEEEITKLALDYHLMSQYTSLVAVDEEIPEGSDTTLPRTVAIPVPMPEGVSYEGVFGPPRGFAPDEILLEAGEKVDTIGRGRMPVDEKLRQVSALRFAGATPRPPAVAYYSRGKVAKSFALKAQARPVRALGTRLEAYYVPPRPASAISVSDKDTTALLKLAITGKDATTRLSAIRRLIGIMDVLPIDLLTKAAKDNDPQIRALVACSLANPKLGKGADEILAKLINDTDVRVAALAIKTAASLRKKAQFIPALEKILLKADPEKRALAVQEAAIGLAKLGSAPQNRPAVQAIFLKALGKTYPESVGKPKVRLRHTIHLAALKTLKGYTKPDGCEIFYRLAKSSDKDVRILAISCLTPYRVAQDFLFQDVVASGKYSDSPDLLATVFKALRKGKYAAQLRQKARLLLAKKEISRRECEVLRVALVETILDVPDDAAIKEANLLLRTDKSWRVRRAILARLATAGPKRFLPAVQIALDDPHPVIKQIALASAVALTSPRSKQEKYLHKLASAPTPATCTEILIAEGLKPDISLLPRSEIRKILTKRGMKL